MRQFTVSLRFFLFLLSGIFIPKLIFSQSIPTLLQSNNLFIQERLESSDPAGWLYFLNSSDLAVGQLFTTQKTAAGLSSDDTMVLIESTQDEFGVTHNRYQQHYKNIKVEGAEMFEHVKDCYVYLLHGKIMEALNRSVQPVYSEQQALTAALVSIGATTYRWESLDWEQELKDDIGDPNATYYPKGKLVLTYLPGAALEPVNYFLGWKFEVFSVTPQGAEIVYVNANTGAVIKSQPMTLDNGPASTSYDGTQIIDTKWAGGLFHGHHHLIADDNDKNIETKSGSSNALWSTWGHKFSIDDVWGSDALTKRTTSAHWVISRSWDFFKDTYGRKGANNNNGKVRVYGNATLPDNARYVKGISSNSVNYFEFGRSSGELYGIPEDIDFAALDIGGHEFTHAITTNEANLVYEKESGALNESFSDIFGVMVEAYSRNGNINWTHGEDLGVVFKSMETPSVGLLATASTYLTDPVWISTVGCSPTDGNDYCGVHTNSGVQNQWFFLLSQGGTKNGITVQGIGATKAARIAYSNLCNFLGTNSGFAEARLGAIGAARILFGACSTEVIQTTNAWAAVGVGAVFSGDCVTIDGDRRMCTDLSYFPYTFTAYGLQGASFIWSFPSTWIGSSSGVGNNTLNITSFGNYNPPAYPATATVSVVSSMGGSSNITVRIYDDCKELCSNEEYRSAKKVARSILDPEVKLHPNPTSRQLIVSFTGIAPRLVSIYSSLGEKMISEKAVQLENIFDVSTFPNGVYIVKIQFEDRTVTEQFVKSY